MTHACELEDFGSQVLENGGNVNGSLGADAHLVLGVGLEETLDTTTWELGRRIRWLVIVNARKAMGQSGVASRFNSIHATRAHIKRRVESIRYSIGKARRQWCKA